MGGGNEVKHKQSPIKYLKIKPGNGSPLALAHPLLSPWSHGKETVTAHWNVKSHPADCRGDGAQLRQDVSAHTGVAQTRSYHVGSEAESLITCLFMGSVSKVLGNTTFTSS